MFNPFKEGRVLVPNFQHRLLLGIGSFVGILLLTGWVAINEPARMDVFTQQFKGRSIENGASIFLNTCATCHGVDGKGGQGPALNNPMLFLKENPAKVLQDKIDGTAAQPGLKQQQASLQGDIDTYLQNVKKLAEDKDKLKTVTAGSKEETDLNTEITSLTSKVQQFDLAGTQRRIDALIGQINDAQAQVADLQKLGWDPTRDVRLSEVKWSGTLSGYIESTIISGRPVSALYWPAPMPAWGREAGGPLRPDEIRNVRDYILNFEDTAVKLTPKDLRTQLKKPGGDTAAVALGKPNPVGMAVEPATITPKLTGGDAAAGQQKYTAAGCAACHNGTTAPNVDGTWTRVVNERLKDPANAGKTAEGYIIESILRPDAYHAPGFNPIMPTDFPTKLSEQDLKDILAFLSTKK